MLRLLAPLFGFAVFGALFAGIYYEPDLVERQDTPKFRLAPEEGKPDFIEPAQLGENVTVNISVLTGGPIDILLVDMENSTLNFLNGTRYGFEFKDEDRPFIEEHSAFNVTVHHNFTFVTDGENRWTLFLVSRVPMPAEWDNMSAEEQEPYVTEVFVSMRYIESEAKSLILGYILATPSVLLVGYTLWVKARRKEEGKDGPGKGIQQPYERDL